MRGFHAICIAGCGDGSHWLSHDARPREFMSKAKRRHGRQDAKLAFIAFVQDSMLAKRIVREVGARLREEGIDTAGWFSYDTDRLIALVFACAENGRIPIYTLAQATELKRRWQEEAEQALLRIAFGGLQKGVTSGIDSDRIGR